MCIRDRVKAVYSRIKDVPQGVDLGATGIIGIVGAGDKSKAFEDVYKRQQYYCLTIM